MVTVDYIWLHKLIIYGHHGLHMVTSVHTWLHRLIYGYSGLHKGTVSCIW